MAFNSLPWRLAWRDARPQWRRLALYTSAMIVGVAAVVAIQSFRQDLRRGVDDQGKALLGADLALTARGAMPEAARAAFKQQPGEVAEEVTLASMASFPGTGDLRLVQVRALSGDWPWYGTIDTQPVSAVATFRRDPVALVDESLMLQLGLRVGDEMRLGTSSFWITGALLRVPGEAAAMAQLAPRVFIGLDYLEATGLLGFGSRAQQRLYLRLPEGVAPATVEAALRPMAVENGLRLTTVAERQRRLGQTLENLNRFLALIGFMALVLGGLGVGAAAHMYMRQKMTAAAVLRCLGASGGQLLATFALQMAALGVAGAILGAGLGVLIQHALPALFGSYAPVQFTPRLSWSAIGLGAGAGVAVTLLFALLPLLALRRVSPLLALRGEETPLVGRDPWRWLALAAVPLGLTGLAVAQAGNWPLGLGFSGAIMVALAILAGLARLLRTAARRLLPRRFPYLWRQGVNNLYRPRNQTTLMMVCLGLGAFLIMTTQFLQGSLMSQLQLTRGDQQSNLVLFDVQTDQLQPLADLMRATSHPVLSAIPMVTMRVASLKDRPIQEWRKSVTKAQRAADEAEGEDRERRPGEPRRVRHWALNREYRSTYRAELGSSEKLVAGEWQGHAPGGQDRVPVSLETGIADDLDLSLGDHLSFDVQGLEIPCVVASLREVDWYRLEPNFFVVFPVGALEDAPQTLLVSTKVGDTRDSGELQRAVIKAFPNISIIDLTQMLDTINRVLDKVSFAISFISFFSIGAGLLVLLAALSAGRYQRLRECVLLRTLGASHRQLQGMLAVEYLCLGTGGALAGLLLAGGGAWAMTHWVFNTAFNPPWGMGLLAWAIMTALTVAAGVFSNRGVASHPPLAVWRDTQN